MKEELGYKNNIDKNIMKIPKRYNNEIHHKTENNYRLNNSGSNYKLLKKNLDRDNSNEEKHMYSVEFKKKSSRKIFDLDNIDRSKTQESF